MRRRNPYYRGPVTDHFDGLRFHSHGEPPSRGAVQTLRFVRGQVAGRWRGLPRGVTPDRPPERAGALRIALIGHSSLLVQVAGLNLLVDPVYAEWLGPFPRSGPQRAHPPGIRWEDLPPIDAVLLTHNHWDHLDGPGLARLWERFRCPVLCPLGNDAILQGYAPGIEVHALDWGQSRRLSGRLVAHCVPAYHWSGRGLGDRRMALWSSWVVTDEAGGALYHVGDTAYGDGAAFREVRARFGAPRVATIPIGSYAPRWYVGHEHIDPEEAVRVMADCGAARAFGHHWGCFQLTWEDRDDPPRELALAVARAGLPPAAFEALQPGVAVAPGWGEA